MEKITGTQKLLIELAKHGCLTVEELEQKTGLKRERIIFYMYRLHKRGLISRKWRHIGGRKYREYCLKYRGELLS